MNLRCATVLQLPSWGQLKFLISTDMCPALATHVLVKVTEGVDSDILPDDQL
jgi:hypothetical protein